MTYAYSVDGDGNGTPWWTWLIIAAVIVLAIVGYYLEHKRRERLLAFVVERGLTYARRDDRWAQIDLGHPHGQGRAHKAKNVMTGQHNGRQIAIFEHEWVTGSGDDRKTHSIRVTAMALPKSFPKVEVRPEGRFGKVVRALGARDIELESGEFNDRYWVNGDRRMAYDVLNPRFMQWMLANEVSGFAINGPYVAYKVGDDIDLDHLDGEVAYLDEIVRRLPRYMTG